MEANGSIGFRKILKHRSARPVVELPSMGMLDDGRPFAVRFRQLRPVEWWATRRGVFGVLPITGGAQSEDDRLAAEMDTDETADILRQYDWQREVVRQAVVEVRDCAQNEHGEFIETWQKVEVAKAGTLETFEPLPDGSVRIPIELFEVGTVIGEIMAAVVQHANFGAAGNVQEATFRAGSAENVRADS